IGIFKPVYVGSFFTWTSRTPGSEDPGYNTRNSSPSRFHRDGVFLWRSHASLYALKRIARRFERGSQVRDMLRPPRFHRNVNHGVAQYHAVIRAVVDRLDDVGFLIRDDGGKSL